MDASHQGDDLILLRPTILERKRVYFLVYTTFFTGSIRGGLAPEGQIHYIILRETRPITNATQSII